MVVESPTSGGAEVVIPIRRRNHVHFNHQEQHPHHHQSTVASPSSRIRARDSPRSGLATPTNKTPTNKGKNTAPPPPPPPEHQKNFKVILAASFLLTINAGFINTVTFSAAHGLPSSHVTGSVSHMSMALVAHDYTVFYHYFVLYICFLIGACHGGMMINYETFYLGRNYGRALFLISAIQGIALLLENSYDGTIFFVWICSYCCGLQNSLTSRWSGNVVRTTHLTGASTDLGIAVGHIMKGRKGEWWKVHLHGIAVVGFFIGGCLGGVGFKHFQHQALMFNVSLTTALAIAHTAYIAYHERLNVLSILESRSDIRLHKHRVTSDSLPSSGKNTPRAHMSPRARSNRNTPLAIKSPSSNLRYWAELNTKTPPHHQQQQDAEDRLQQQKDISHASLLTVDRQPRTFSSSSSDAEVQEEEEKQGRRRRRIRGVARSPGGSLPPEVEQSSVRERGGDDEEESEYSGDDYYSEYSDDEEESFEPLPEEQEPLPYYDSDDPAARLESEDSEWEEEEEEEEEETSSYYDEDEVSSYYSEEEEEERAHGPQQHSSDQIQLVVVKPEDETIL